MHSESLMPPAVCPAAPIPFQQGRIPPPPQSTNPIMSKHIHDLASITAALQNDDKVKLAGVDVDGMLRGTPPLRAERAARS